MYLLLALTCAASPAAPDAIALAEAALADFRPEDAVQLLESAEGPHDYRRHVLLYEQLGIAYAYLDRAEDAVGAFRRMLALDPSRALSYTLSPKVTFLFERARKETEALPSPYLDVSWPRRLQTADGVPVNLEVVADPLGFLRRAELRYRLRGTPSWQTAETELAPVHAFETVELPALGAGASSAQTVELYVVAFDGRGNEVQLIGREDRPREIELAYATPKAWYEEWWVWAAAGAVVAAGAAGAVAVASGSQSTTIDAVVYEGSRP